MKSHCRTRVLIFCHHLICAMAPILCFVILPLICFGAVRYVPSPYATIQAAIDASSDSDEIVVSPGTYYENINFNGKSIILRSTDPTSASVVASTIIDGSSSDSVVRFVGNELASCVLSGFTITHGYANVGGGIYGAASEVTIQYNYITSNTVTAAGGGISEGAGTIADNIICYNSAESGGGLYLCTGTTENNLISSNSASFLGGGVYACGGTVQKNTISGNVAQYSGGGISSCWGTVFDNVISDNHADQYGGGIADSDTITSNNIRSNWAENGGGLYRCDGSIEQNRICENEALYGGGLFYCGADITDNIISDNSAQAGGGLYECNGNIEENTIVSNSATGAGGGLSYCDATITSNTILGNTGEASGGGLAYCDGAIRGNIISGNSTTGFYCAGGGLISCNNTIEGNTISSNSSSYFAGGLAACMGTIQGNIIRENSAIDFGGGLWYCDGTIQHNTISGNSSASAGGGLASCNGLIEYNTIVDNLAGSGGGLFGCNATIQHNTFSGNTVAHDGGAIESCHSATIQSNSIYGNSATWYGGGIASSNCAIYDNTIHGNSAKSGGGIYDSDGAILNNTVYANAASGSGGGLFACDGAIRDCIIWQNTAPSYPQLRYCSTPSYSCIQNWSGGTGNISVNPHLIDPVNADFHLLADSPCIDAGGTVTLTQDFEDDIRPYAVFTWDSRGDGSYYDIGADEFIGAVPSPTPTATPTPTPSPTPASQEELTYTFDTAGDSWTYSTVTGYSLPLFDASGEMINISSQNDTVNRFGFWQTDPGVVTYTSDTVYRARYAVQTDQLTPASIPTIRMRFTTELFTGSAAHSVVSLGTFSYAPPTSGTKEYRMLYYPAVADNLGFAFDMLDFDTGEWGTISLDSAIVETFPRAVFSGTEVRTYDSDGDFAAWQWSGNFGNPVWSGCTSGRSGGTISITSAGQPQAAFWQSPQNDLTYVADRLYRATFTMSRAAGNVAATMPWCRIRCFNEDGQMSQEFNINNGDSGAAMPPETPAVRDYEVYWQTPDLPSSPSTDEDGFRIAIDALNFGPGETGTFILDTVIIEHSDIPAYSTP
jgi:hypothetical protein